MNEKGVRDSTLRDIEKAIDEIYLENPSGFKLVHAEIQRRSGISRPTLGKPSVQDHIKQYISRLPKAHDLLLDQRSECQAEIRRLRAACARLRSERQIILTQFTDLFSRIYGESIDIQKLINSREVSNDNHPK